MDDLLQFLRDRLDEDASLAKEADEIDPAPWSADARDEGGNNAHQQQTGYGVVSSPDGDLWQCSSSATAMAAITSRHVARHDPARVLAEVAAKREILALHRRMTKRSTGGGGGTVDDCSLCNHFPAQYPCMTLRLLALTYADHPDYNEAWRT